MNIFLLYLIHLQLSYFSNNKIPISLIFLVIFAIVFLIVFVKILLQFSLEQLKKLKQIIPLLKDIFLLSVTIGGSSFVLAISNGGVKPDTPSPPPTQTTAIELPIPSNTTVPTTTESPLPSNTSVPTTTVTPEYTVPYTSTNNDSFNPVPINTDPDAPDYIKYTVQEGDSIALISLSYYYDIKNEQCTQNFFKKTYTDVAYYNDIDINTFTIYPNQKLRFKIDKSTMQFYEIKPEDLEGNLFKTLAREYYGEPEKYYKKIMIMNDIDSLVQLQPGKYLIIPYIYEKYKITSDITLHKIMTEHHLNPEVYKDKILELNKIESEKKIPSGQEVWIPIFLNQ